MRTFTQWSDAEERMLWKLLQEGRSSPAIADAINGQYGTNRTAAAVRSKIKSQNEHSTRMNQRPVERAPLPVADFHQAAAKVQVKNLEAELARMRSAAGVVQQWEDDWDGPEEWARAEKDSVKRIEKAQKQGKFDIAFDRPIALVAISDQHIAPGTPVDFRRMREDAELVANQDGFYALLGGDGIDGHIKHRAAVLAARSQPDDQYRLFNHYLSIFSSKILCMVTGNHEWWSNQIGGVDMVARLAEQNRICYAGHEARLTVRVGGHPYEVMIRHQSRFNSSFNQSHAVKRHFEMGEGPYDIGIIGHHHEHCCESFIRHGMIRWACRPGSYQITSAYSKQFGFADSIPTCPTFILIPGKREIVGFADVRQAAKAFRGFA